MARSAPVNPWWTKFYTPAEAEELPEGTQGTRAVMQHIRSQRGRVAAAAERPIRRGEEVVTNDPRHGKTPEEVAEMTLKEKS